MPGLRRRRLRACLEARCLIRRHRSDAEAEIAADDERMVEEGPVELTDPARVSVDLGGDEHVAGRRRHRLG